MSLWLQILVSGGLLLAVLAYAVWHVVPGRYAPPPDEQIGELEDGLYLFLNPG